MLEIDYYRTQSGLPQGLSLQDYQIAYWRAQTALPVGLSHGDYKLAFYKSFTGLPDVDTAERMYFYINTGMMFPNLSKDDLKQRFFDAQ